jgi:hypothetical protein
MFVIYYLISVQTGSRLINVEDIGSQAWKLLYNLIRDVVIVVVMSYFWEIRAQSVQQFSILSHLISCSDVRNTTEEDCSF